MGAECPNGHGRQNVIANITADGSPPTKNADVIAQKLACGCVVGGADYEAFQNQVLEIRNTEKLAITQEKEKARKAIGAAFKAFNEKKGD
jgi:hypothetical protein